MLVPIPVSSLLIFPVPGWGLGAEMEVATSSLIILFHS